MKKLLASAIISIFAFHSVSGACEAHQGHGGHKPPTTPNPTCAIEFKSIMTCAQIEFAKTPTSVEDASFTLTLNSHHALDIKKLSVDLWMDMGHGHGHGSAPVSIEQTGANTYKVSNVWFVMMGEWQVKVAMETSEGLVEGIYTVNVTK